MNHKQKRLAKQMASLLAIFAGAALLLGAMLLLPGRTAASSHREAPLISKDPYADNTDTYAFVSPDNPDRLVLAASWIPFEGPEGGPNYWEWDDNVLYQIHVDVDGDAQPDVNYSLQSVTQAPEGAYTFLYNTGPVTTLNDPDLNRRQYVTVYEQFTPGMEPAGSVTHTHTLMASEVIPPVNVGSKSTPDYEQLMQEGVHTYTDAGNGDVVQVFAGQTDDAFFVDLQVFDLLTLRGQSPPVGYSEGNNVPVDSVSGFNVHSLVVEVPIDRLVRDSEPVLGVWSTASRPTMRVLQGLGGTPPGGATHSGDFVQVSRLGMPLVNEVVIPMNLKDTFNALPPELDLSAYSLLQGSVEDAEVARLLCQLYGIPLPADGDDDCDTDYTPGTPRSGRGDIFDIFLRGMVLENPFTVTRTNGLSETLPAGTNINRPAGAVPAEMIRINTSISGADCAPEPSRLGLLGGDACGFPNGRRLTDDVVDIELLAVAGAAYEALDARDSSFSFDPSLISVLDDNVDANDRPFQDVFPYLAPANSGQSHFHDNPILQAFVPIVVKGQAMAQSAGEAAAKHPIQAAAVAGGAFLAAPAILWLRRRKDEKRV